MATLPSDRKLGFQTRAIHAGQRPDPRTGALVSPIYQCSVFAQARPGEAEFDYGRSSNPGYLPIEAALADLEDGQHATVVSSGVGAMTAVMTLLSAGDHVVMPTDVYGGTYRLFKQVFERFGLRYTQVDLRDLDAVAAALETAPQMLYMESPTNPLLQCYDLAALAEMAWAKKVRTVVDNTFASPCFQNPLALGVDIVLHSTSKYIGGHSDIVGGVVVTNDEEVRARMDYARKSMGLHADPMTMFLCRRGMKTLGLRMARHQENAFAAARFLEAHPKVERVLYPGLESHPDHEVAARQMSGFSGMVTAFFRCDDEAAKKMISSYEVLTLAESLGAVESLVEHPASMTHQKIPRKTRLKHGVTDGLIRFSFGTEDPEDILADLERGLAAL